MGRSFAGGGWRSTRSSNSLKRTHTLGSVQREMRGGGGGSEGGGELGFHGAAPVVHRVETHPVPRTGPVLGGILPSPAGRYLSIHDEPPLAAARWHPPPPRTRRHGHEGRWQVWRQARSLWPLPRGLGCGGGELFVPTYIRLAGAPAVNVLRMGLGAAARRRQRRRPRLPDGHVQLQSSPFSVTAGQPDLIWAWAVKAQPRSGPGWHRRALARCLQPPAESRVAIRHRDSHRDSHTLLKVST